MPLRPGSYEVWLLDPDTGRMVSISDLGPGADALPPLPANVELWRYRVVDVSVSAGDYDGNPGHSGCSMLRGTLTS
jgi:hypothetical protein